ncbi:MAG: fucose isomerase [Clostridiales bacterium]|nr:fucose isomerase [Clostridiales bacterium]
MLNYKIKIGLAPCRRWLPGKRTGIFNPEYARMNKTKVLAFLDANYAAEDVEFVNLDFLNEEGMMFDINQAQEIADRFAAEKVDALFIINCNFGSEEVACKVAKLVNKPTLLWGPRDDIFEVDGTRYTDAQCGLFAISKGLQRFGIPFSYIENCDIEADVFDTDFRKFLSVVTMLKNFRSLRIGQIGTRPKPFNSVICNEGELIEKFGIEIVPINMAIVTQEFNRCFKEYHDRLAGDIEDLKSKFDTEGIEQDMLERMMTFKYMYKSLAEQYNLSLIATECWTSMLIAVNAMPCTAMSLLADEGLIVTCETDIMGAISMALLSCASRGKSRPFFGEFTVRNPQNTNSELLWHCGPFPYSLKKPGYPANLPNNRPNFRLKDGKYTICRLDSLAGDYQLLAGKLKTCDGPKVIGTYIWAEFDSYAKWEKKLIYGPYIHHMAEIEGDYVAALEEFTRFEPNIRIDLA